MSSVRRTGREPVLRAAVENALESVRPALRAHAGDVEIVSLDRGSVQLRFLGMCRGCPLRPVTTASTLRPALMAVSGVKEVSVEGSRVSAEAEDRLARALGSRGSGTAPPLGNVLV